MIATKIYLVLGSGVLITTGGLLGSNADAGWGVWSTLSDDSALILLSLIMMDQDNNFWDYTHRQLNVKKEMSRSLWMTGD